jgi:hypothetical protein
VLITAIQATEKRLYYKWLNEECQREGTVGTTASDKREAFEKGAATGETARWMKETAHLAALASAPLAAGYFDDMDPDAACEYVIKARAITKAAGLEDRLRGQVLSLNLQTADIIAKSAETAAVGDALAQTVRQASNRAAQARDDALKVEYSKGRTFIEAHQNVAAAGHTAAATAAEKRTSTLQRTDPSIRDQRPASLAKAATLISKARQLHPDMSEPKAVQTYLASSDGAAHYAREKAAAREAAPPTTRALLQAAYVEKMGTAASRADAAAYGHDDFDDDAAAGPASAPSAPAEDPPSVATLAAVEAFHVALLASGLTPQEFTASAAGHSALARILQAKASGTARTPTVG